MLQTIKQLCGNKLGASDGEIGHVKDLYFDGENWAVRYVVAETGHWLPGRQVLISPLACGSLVLEDKVLTVKLSLKQIEDSPGIETHKPVSRQYEAEYHHYYGWPNYWEGGGLWGGTRGFPILESTHKLTPDEKPAGADQAPLPADSQLRSTQAVNGYHLQATDGIMGHVCDFLMDKKSWAITQLIVKIGHRFTGREVLVAVRHVERISYKQSTVFVKLTKEEVENSLENRWIPGEPLAA